MRLDSAPADRYSAHPRDAQVAQLVEQRTENPRVGGSNPPLGTTSLPDPPSFSAAGPTGGVAQSHARFAGGPRRADAIFRPPGASRRDGSTSYRLRMTLQHSASLKCLLSL